MNSSIKYPLEPRIRLLDRVVLKIGLLPIFCTVCGSLSFCIVWGSLSSITNIAGSLRESCLCIKCKSSNRRRQLAYVICRSISAIKKKGVYSLKELRHFHDIAVYNTEAQGPLHRALSKMQHYICSEYLGPEYKSGEYVSGILHEDLMNLSFEDESFDLVITADVMEHVSEPYKAHKEIYRILKPNGRHIFTVPFDQTDFLNDQRAVVDTSGNVVFLKEPTYHSDPLRPEGALVYTIFSLQMLVELRHIGFRTNLWHLYKPWYGILGSNAIVFEAIKI